MTASAVVPTNEATGDGFSVESMLVHHPNYHRSTDVPEALDMSAVETMTRVTALAVSILANAED